QHLDNIKEKRLFGNVAFGSIKFEMIEILLIISNPVHHGLVNAPKDWQHSSFHRYVEEGIYDQMWGASERLIFDSDIGME
ncbi:MAG: hypothetical protein IM550_16800, partial [Microcystis sp. M54BS1]|uniref:hypothetical protein n=1 Tax=unclassified Microcystis TaxID=2643300 RepID=UPI00257D9D7E